jgi:flagellar protein FlaI
VFELRSTDGCRCEPSFEDDVLCVDATDCEGSGALADAPACRATVVTALEERDVNRVVTLASGRRRVYAEGAVALLVAAGRFAAAVAFHDEALADRSRRDPLDAARVATGRAGPVSRLAAETGLAEAAAAGTYEEVIAPRRGVTVAAANVGPRPPDGATLADRYELDTGGVVRVYHRSDDSLATYHLTPVELTLSREATATLAAAADHLAANALGGDRAAGRAVRRVAEPGEPVETLAGILHRHTRGLGVLSDVFADPAVSDAYATPPVDEGPLRLEHEGEPVRSNVYLTPESVAALASRLRRESGRAFSRADPTLDATVEVGDRELRVAGVTDPVSDGNGFAFRAHDADRFRLADLVANGTLPPAVAALLSVAVERGAALLIAGGRGVGKTTLLGALLPELPAGTRAVVVEDTPELPVGALRAAGRDCQRLTVDRDGDGIGPQEALHAALRLGEGALVVGEVRGSEAGALYEAMRVGAGGATLGTVHGDGPTAVRERVVTDLGVAPSAFTDTDLVVTLDRGSDGRGVASIVEVVGRTDPAFAPLFERDGGDVVATGRIDRGNSAALADLAASNEQYDGVRGTIERRRERFAAE